MPDPMTVRPKMPERNGIAADHGGFESMEREVNPIFAPQFNGTQRHRLCIEEVAGPGIREART
jgi:hypothetical protein